MKNPSSQKNLYGKILISLLLSFLLHIPLMLFFFTYKPIFQYSQVHPKIFDLIELKSINAQRSIPVQEATKSPSNKKENVRLKKQFTEALKPASVKKEDTDTIDKHILPEIISDLPTDNSETAVQSNPQLDNQNLSSSSMHNDTIIDAKESGIKPQKIFSPAPTYPSIALDLGISGIVRALLTIDTSGLVKEIKIVKSPHSSMSDEVVRTLNKWKFKPIRHNGQKVILKQLVQEIEFKE